MKSYAPLLMLALSGCASTPTIYNPNKLDNSELVKLTTHQDLNPFNNQYSSFIEGITNSNGEEIIKKNLLGNSLTEFSLPKGTYKFKVNCTKRSLTWKIETIYSLEREGYQISCIGAWKVNVIFTEIK